MHSDTVEILPFKWISFLNRQARQLIEQTIQRNASPVRSADCGPGVDMPHLMSLKEEESSAYMMQQSGRQSVNAMDPVLGDFQYTVTVGEESIKITGKNLALVQAAKLALDDHFAALAGDRNVSSSSRLVNSGVHWIHWVLTSFV